MKRIKTLMLLLAVCIIAFSAPAYSYTMYTSNTDFLSAIQENYFLEDFNSYTYGSFIEFNLSESGNGYSWTMSSSPSSLYSTDGAMSTGSHNDVITVSFTGNPVTAIGGIFGASETDGDFIPGTINLTFSDGSSLTNHPVSVGDFSGFTFSTPITSMTFTSSDFPQIDNFYIGAQAAAVPIPPSVWLLGSGLVGLVGLRRKLTAFLKK
jgi:hypothetical protein